MNLEEFAQAHSPELERALGRVQRLQRELATARQYARQLEDELAAVRQLVELQRHHNDANPQWLRSPRSTTEHRATLVSILSDLHLDEVVRPDEIGKLNAYNRAIAELRLERYVRRAVMLARQYLSGVEYDGVVLMLGGDLVSGFIHEELSQTNEAPLPATIAHWVPYLAAVISGFADEFGRVHVPVVPGNHGRMTRKPRAKLRAIDNADWLLGQLLAARFTDDDRITFDITEGTDVLVRVYDTTFLLTHGDQATGGSGIGGIWPPIKRLEARKRERYAAAGQTFDWLVMGHWHQYVHAQGLIVNGSLKGYDEYAAVNNFPPERAQQALWVVTPENGVTWAAPVFVDDPDAEGWRRAKRRRAK